MLNEISQYGMATTINNASSSAQRLAACADHLNLEWVWLVQRCRNAMPTDF